MLNLSLIQKLIEAHEELAIAVEDFSNDVLSEGHRRRLAEALANSLRLIAEAAE
jgi:hypothetical protein